MSQQTIKQQARRMAREMAERRRERESGPSLNRIRKLTQCIVTALGVLFGEVFGRDERSCMDSLAW